MRGRKTGGSCPDRKQTAKSATPAPEAPKRDVTATELDGPPADASDGVVGDDDRAQVTAKRRASTIPVSFQFIDCGSLAWLIDPLILNI
jgi:hypothetical protein